MKIVNLTPHAIVLSSSSGEITIPPSGTGARVSSVSGKLETIPGIPIPVDQPSVLGEVSDLPEPQENTFFVVSGMVLQKLAGKRADVLGPGTGPNDNPVRNEKGQICAITRFVR